MDHHWSHIGQQLDRKDIQSANNFLSTLHQFQSESKQDAAKQSAVRVFENFVSLSAGPRHGELPLLGHFALIEALITHDPHQSGDSLNHQLSTKMPLLMRRFEPPLIMADYFDIADEKKTWKLLYRLRSKVAHGEFGAFARGTQSPLRNIDTVFKFVRSSLKRLLILSLKEPQFVFDLKAC